MATPQTVKQGESIILTASFKNDAGALFDPTVSKTIRIADPSGTLTITDGAMVTDASVVGKWKYTYTLAADAPTGEWTYECKGVTAGPLTGMGDFRFYVAESL